MGDFTKRYHEYVKESDRVVSLLDVKPEDGFLFRKHLVDMLNYNFFLISRPDVSVLEFARGFRVVDTLLSACFYLQTMSDDNYTSYHTRLMALKHEYENREKGGIGL